MNLPFFIYLRGWHFILYRPFCELKLTSKRPRAWILNVTAHRVSGFGHVRLAMRAWGHFVELESLPHKMQVTMTLLHWPPFNVVLIYRSAFSVHYIICTYIKYRVSMILIFKWRQARRDKALYDTLYIWPVHLLCIHYIHYIHIWKRHDSNLRTFDFAT